MRSLLVWAMLGMTIAAISLGLIFFPHQQPPLESMIIHGKTPLSAQVYGSIPYWDQKAAIASFKARPDLFDHVAVFWYRLKGDGSIARYPYAQEDKSLIKFAHDHQVKVLPVITNLPGEDESGSWDSDRVQQVIGSEEARLKHIQELLKLVEKHNFDGVNIDYEALQASQEKDFTLFAQELADALHQRGKIIGIALLPKPREGDPDFSNGSEAQDWTALGKVADHLYIMTYEEHWETSSPGPVASLPWVKSILSYAKTKIPAHKIFIGIPLYGYDWGGSSAARGLTQQQVNSLQERSAAKIRFDARAQSPYFHYQAGERTHRVWYEDERSLAAKLELMKQLGLSNLALWRLGHENPGIWPLLHRFKTTVAAD